MSPGPIQLDQATALTLMLGPNGSVGIQASLARESFSNGRDGGFGLESDNLFAVFDRFFRRRQAHAVDFELPALMRCSMRTEVGSAFIMIDEM